MLQQSWLVDLNSRKQATSFALFLAVQIILTVAAIYCLLKLSPVNPTWALVLAGLLLFIPRFGIAAALAIFGCYFLIK